MTNQQYRVGSVLDPKNIPTPEELALNIGEHATSYYRLRNQITSRNVTRVNGTIDGLIAEDLRKGKYEIFLDVGGSDGSRAHNIHTLYGNRLDLHVVDIDAGSVSKAAKLGINAQQGDINERLPYDDKSFDVVSLLWTLDQIPEGQKKRVIKEMHRILADRGTFYLQVGKFIDFEHPSKQLGYPRGTFFNGVFEPTGEGSAASGLTRNSIHGDVSDLNPAYRLVTKPMYSSLFTLDKIRELTSAHFDLEKIYLVSFDKDETKSGIVLADNAKDIESKHKDTNGLLLAILKKK
ncbi:methyltransferase domain-containing protein [Candidatus Woesearchaeota archaeon]|nr:methyltransferase domain-containing protein [Candidatus Woesearchaeota archaeon]